jgi:hypothetical protein
MDTAMWPPAHARRPRGHPAAPAAAAAGRPSQPAQAPGLPKDFA